MRFSITTIKSKPSQYISVKAFLFINMYKKKIVIMLTTEDFFCKFIGSKK